MIFQSCATPFKNRQIWQKMKKKPCSTCLKPISPWHCEYPEPRFQVSVPPTKNNAYKNHTHYLIDSTIDIVFRQISTFPEGSVAVGVV